MLFSRKQFGIVLALLALLCCTPSLAKKTYTTHLSNLQITRTFTVEWLNQCMALDRRAMRGASPLEQLSTVLLRRQGWARQANFNGLGGLEYYTGQMMQYEQEIQFRVDSENQANVNGITALWLSHHFISGGVINIQSTNQLFVPELFGQLLIHFHQVQVVGDQQNQPIWLVQANIPVSVSATIPVTLKVFHNEEGNVQMNAYDGFLSSVSGVAPAVFTVFEDLSDEDQEGPEGQTVELQDEASALGEGMGTLQIRDGDEKSDESKPQWMSEDYLPSKKSAVVCCLAVFCQDFSLQFFSSYLKVSYDLFSILMINRVSIYID
ncbi:hypothetical protein [Endozoicomonas arenosclerae]|uniref:hypothetical protein n=1 Tax=Endozoicomonas arenosclerae TaxID=1633495 RepID=UPI0012947A08|nr:hypothetical protein [Endozoicomonas arenosclerae]